MANLYLRWWFGGWECFEAIYYSILILIRLILGNRKFGGKSHSIHELSQLILPQLRATSVIEFEFAQIFRSIPSNNVRNKNTTNNE